MAVTAVTLQDLRAERVTSIHGLRLGLDVDEFTVGNKGHRVPIHSGTSDTTGTALPNHGIVTLVTSTNDSWNLSAPTPGCEVSILNASSSGSTGIATVLGNGATFQSCESSTGPSILLTGPNAGAHLIGLSTGLWGVIAEAGTSAVTHVST